MTKKISSLYLHFPFCRHLCNYCDFFKKVSPNLSSDLGGFHNYLEEAFDQHEKLMKKHGYSWAVLETLYIGGGTPSLWGEEGANFVNEFFKKRSLKLAANCEFTMEVNPGAWTPEGLAQWESVGVNRYSLGIQALNAQAIKYLDRVHTLENVYETLEYFSQKKANYSVDFMLGLPYSESLQRNIKSELETIMKYAPTHLSVYILTVKENYTHFKKLPTEEWIEKEFLEVADYLRDQGYSHYEVSNFAKPGKESEHNLRYWRSAPVAALGPSATGFFPQDKLRYKWKTKEASLELEVLNEGEFLLEQIYMALRSEGIPLQEKIKENPKWEGLAQKWIDQKHATLTDKGILRLSSRGYLLLDSLMNEIFLQKIL